MGTCLNRFASFVASVIGDLPSGSSHSPLTIIVCCDGITVARAALQVLRKVLDSFARGFVRNSVATSRGMASGVSVLVFFMLIICGLVRSGEKVNCNRRTEHHYGDQNDY